MLKVLCFAIREHSPYLMSEEKLFADVGFVLIKNPRPFGPGLLCFRMEALKNLSIKIFI